MREIKFRAWSPKKKKMVNDYAKQGNGFNAIEVVSWHSSSDLIAESNWILMQFTGLKDSKRTEEFTEGQDIFEGDIVEYDNGTKAKVIFKEGAFVGYDGFATSSEEAYLLLTSEEVPFDDSFEIEVIGNIHQHPKH